MLSFTSIDELFNLFQITISDFSRLVSTVIEFVTFKFYAKSFRIRHCNFKKAKTNIIYEIPIASFPNLINRLFKLIENYTNKIVLNVTFTLREIISVISTSKNAKIH